MKSTTFTLSALASLGLVFAEGWYNNTEIVPPNSETAKPGNNTETVPPITTYTTQTGYTTYCPESTVITITVCEDHTCAPHVYTVPESSTLTVTEECVFPIPSKNNEAHETPASSVSPASTIAAVSTYEAGAAKLAAGFAGVVGIALLI